MLLKIIAVLVTVAGAILIYAATALNNSVDGAPAPTTTLDKVALITLVAGFALLKYAF